MAEKKDKKDWEELAVTFKVSPEICEQYNQFYDKVIRPRIEKNYLAALISVVEGLIDMKIREKLVNKISKNKSEKKVRFPYLRRYKIILSDRPPRKNVKAYTSCFPQGAIIVYDPKNSEKDICFSIAHELGNLLIKNEVIPGSSSENLADLFAHFASEK